MSPASVKTKVMRKIFGYVFSSTITYQFKRRVDMAENYKDLSYEELKQYDKELGRLIAEKEKTSFLFSTILFFSAIVLLFFSFRLASTIFDALTLKEFSVLGLALFFVIKSIYMDKEVKKLKDEYCDVYVELGVKQEKMRRAMARKEFKKIVAKVERDKSKKTNEELDNKI